MLREIEELHDMTVCGADAVLGSIHDAYFDDTTWTVRYLVIDTGAWLAGRHVLVSSGAVRRIDFDGLQLQLDIDRDGIRHSAHYHRGEAVPRRCETAVASCYDYPDFSGVSTCGTAAAAGRPQLRSARAVTGCAVAASDGAAGHVESLLFEPRSWEIPAMVVCSAASWPGGPIVVPGGYVCAIDWCERLVSLRTSRAELEMSANHRAHRASASADLASPARTA